MSLTESQKLYATALEQVTSLQRAIDGSNQRFVQLEEEKSEVIAHALIESTTRLYYIFIALPQNNAIISSVTQPNQITID